MHLKITSESLIRDIQKEFNTIYPFLWIEFFYDHKNGNEYRPKSGEKYSRIWNDDRHKFNRAGIVDISSDRTAAQLEKDFWETFGIRVKILRKSGNVWVSTFYTGDWTLENQNHQGQAIEID